MVKPISPAPRIRREAELDPAERRLIDRLAEYGVLPTGKSPLVPLAPPQPMPTPTCSTD